MKWRRTKKGLEAVGEDNYTYDIEKRNDDKWKPYALFDGFYIVAHFNKLKNAKAVAEILEEDRS